MQRIRGRRGTEYSSLGESKPRRGFGESTLATAFDQNENRRLVAVGIDRRVVCVTCSAVLQLLDGGVPWTIGNTGTPTSKSIKN